MPSSTEKFDWKQLRNLYLTLLFLIIALPLFLMLFFSLIFKDTTLTTTKTQQQIQKKVEQNQKTKPKAAKLVLLNTNPNKPALTSASDDSEDETSQSNTTPPSSNPPTNTPPPTSSPPTTPPSTPTQSEIEFSTGTVTAVSGDIVTFSYVQNGMNMSVDVTLTETSPSSVTLGSVWHVHAKRSDGVYFEDEMAK
ncbi:MAG: hypothetical protein Q7T50_05860 [Candidatus Magasanikbacteria bacterium]|nr:hypothetical protein [Candidatus Magasanikbacteria bacterium]